MEQEQKMLSDIRTLIELAEHYLDRSHFFGGARKRLEAKIKEMKDRYGTE